MEDVEVPAEEVVDFGVHWEGTRVVGEEDGERLVSVREGVEGFEVARFWEMLALCFFIIKGC